MAGTVAGSAPPAAGNAPLTADQFTNQTWAAVVILLDGAPLTANNLANVTAWMTAENAASTWTGTAGANNPLNNGLGSGGGSGLGSYPDLATAAIYAAKGINGGITGAAPIGAALRADAPFSVFHQATLNASWSGDHYAGTGWAAETSPSPPSAVSAAQSAKNGASSGVSVGNITNNDLGSSGALQTALGSLTGLAGATGLTGAAATAAGNAAKNALSWTEELAKVLGEIDTLAFWQRFGMGVLGVGLIIGGFFIFFASTKTGQKAMTEGTQAAEVAAVA